MKYLKKLSALILALVMMFALTATAFAVDTPNSNHTGTGEGDETLAVLTDANEIAIRKDIVLYNAEGEKIYAPNVVYTYGVAPAETTANSVDITGIILDDSTAPFDTTTVTVRNGITGGVLLANVANGTGAATTTITFTNGDALDAATPLTEGTDATTNNASDAKTSKNLYVQFDPNAIYTNNDSDNTTFNPAGIYRYKITDNTTRTTLAAAGILRNDDYDTSYKTLYLDLYLKNVTDSTTGAVTGLAVYGYVLFKSGDKDTEFTYSQGSTETLKLTGFNVDSEKGTTSGSTTPVISDQYHTYNLKVTKKTTGALADKNHYFPFDITLTEAAGNTATKVYVTYTNAQNVKDGASTPSSIANNTGTVLSAGATATNFTGEIKDGGNIKFTGIPMYVAYNSSTNARDTANDHYATADAKETNDTYDTYKATATEDSVTGTNVQLAYKALSTASSESTTTATEHAAVLSNTGYAHLNAALSVDGSDGTNVIGNSIDFTNTLDAISPTGVVLRVAPYALIMAFGAALVIFLAIRRRKEEEA